MTLDTQLTWSAHVNQVRKRAAQKLGVLGPPPGEAARPSETVCCSAGSSPVLWWIARVPSGGPLHAAASGSCKFHSPRLFTLRLAHLAWYVGNRQIHDDMGIPFFADHFRAPTESFDSKLADAGNPLVRQLAGRWCYQRAD
jgi:hypothetical protein